MESIDFVESTIENNYLPVEIFEKGNKLCEDCYNYLNEQITEFEALNQNWDGYGGISLMASIAVIARKFIAILSAHQIDCVTDIFPNPNGTITFEWENETNEKLSLEIGEANYSYFVKFANKQPKFINGQNIIEDFAGFAESFSELFSEINLSIIYE